MFLCTPDDFHHAIETHESIDVPAGYTLLSRTRRPKLSFDKSWGGVAALIRNTIPFKYREDLSGPDFMVIQIDRLLVYNVYLLPESSQWVGALEKDSCEALAASKALAYAAGFKVSLHSDLNARTGSTLAYPTDPPRHSMDTAAPSPRGNLLCNMLGDYGVAFASGTICLGPNSGNFTSFQGKTAETMRKTVVDYVACLKEIFPDIASFTVCDRVPGYDHAATVLRLKLDVDLQNSIFASPRKKRKLDFSLPDDTDLDKLFIATLEAGKDTAKKLTALYGPVLVVTAPLKITVHGTCLNAGKISAAAGAFAYWGPNARLNQMGRVYGTQTSPRAELLAVILAVKGAPTFKSIVISTRSEYAIRSVVYYAAKNDACGWRCINGDLLKVLVALIKIRMAPVQFCHIKKDIAPKDEENRRRVMDAPSSGIFWKEVKRLADPKPAPISVSASSLKDTFEKRLNAPEVLPPQFDSTQHSINKILANLLPASTEDHTPEGFFTTKWNVDDMGRLKDHLRASILPMLFPQPTSQLYG
ncbi:hypothetical protein B0H10DRAFT_2224808 [Mycena sp. CBHHK59/15]|nr:hypothetical protein B0H10DRAFT_2224808 [Mycena sp. CBHHK59/15]